MKLQCGIRGGGLELKALLGNAIFAQYLVEHWWHFSALFHLKPSSVGEVKCVPKELITGDGNPPAATRLFWSCQFAPRGLNLCC